MVIKQLFAILLLVLSVLSATVTGKSSSGQAPQSLRKLLYQVVEEARTLDDLRMSARLQAWVAEVIWRWYKDEKATRVLYEKALETAINYYRQSPPPEEIGPRTYEARPDERLSIIKQIMLFDSRQLDELVGLYIQERERYPTRDEGGPNPKFASQKSWVWLKLAEHQRSGGELHDELMRKSLANGTSDELARYLKVLAAKNRRQANKYYKMALDLFAEGKLQSAAQFLWLSAYPFGDWVIQIGVKSGIGTWSVFPRPEGEFVDRELINKFFTTAQIVFTRLLGGGPEGSGGVATGQEITIAYEAVCDLEWKVKEYAPGLLAEWQQMKAKLGARVSAEPLDKIERAKQDPSTDLRNYRRVKLAPGGDRKVQPHPDYNFLVAGGYLYILPKERPELRQVGSSRHGQDHPSQNRDSTISGQDTDARTWAKMNKAIYLEPDELSAFQAANQAIREWRWEEAHRQLSLLKQSDVRALNLVYAMGRMLSDISEAAPRRDEKYILERIKLAREFLNEAAQLASTAADSYAKACAQILAADGYVRLERSLKEDQALQSYSGSIDPVPVFDLLTAGINTANRLPKVELNKSVKIVGPSTFTDLPGIRDEDVRQLFFTLTGRDLKRPLALANEFKDKTIRLTALLGIIEAQLPVEARKARVSRGCYELQVIS